MRAYFLVSGCIGGWVPYMSGVDGWQGDFVMIQAYLLQLAMPLAWLGTGPPALCHLMFILGSMIHCAICLAPETPIGLFNS